MCTVETLPQNQGTPSNIGGVIGGTTGTTGQQSSGGGILQTVGNVVVDVLNPLGGLLNLL